MERSEDLYENDDAFQSVYGTKYETIVDNYSHYWLCADDDSYDIFGYVDPYNRCVSNIRPGGANGVRALVTLSSKVKLSKASVGKKTITDSRDETKSWTYNIWNIE